MLEGRRLQQVSTRRARDESQLQTDIQLVRMTCGPCGAHFCYVCNKQTDKPGHWNSGERRVRRCAGSILTRDVRRRSEQWALPRQRRQREARCGRGQWLPTPAPRTAFSTEWSVSRPKRRASARSPNWKRWASPCRRSPRRPSLVPQRHAAPQLNRQRCTRTAATSSAGKTPLSTSPRSRKPLKSRSSHLARAHRGALRRGSRQLHRLRAAGPTLTASAGTRTSLHTVSPQQGAAFSVEADSEARGQEPEAGTAGRARGRTKPATKTPRRRRRSPKRSCASAGCTRPSRGRAALDRQSLASACR